MARKKQVDLEDAIDESNGHAAPGKPGHNSQLTDDERRALTLHHKQLYEAADALVEKAKDDRKAVADLAKSDLGKGAVADIKALIEFADITKARGQIETAMRLARWCGMPVGTQSHMFEAPADRREDGKIAGMEGKACQPPQHLAQVEAQKWIEGWHEGQTILASAFKKKRVDVESETEPTVDTSDPPFNAPIDVQFTETPTPPAMPA